MTEALAEYRVLEKSRKEKEAGEIEEYGHIQSSKRGKKKSSKREKQKTDTKPQVKNNMKKEKDLIEQNPNAKKFEVECIVERKTQGAGYSYLVKYKDYEVPEWASRSHLLRQLPQLMKDYERKHPLSGKDPDETEICTVDSENEGEGDLDEDEGDVE